MTMETKEAFYVIWGQRQQAAHNADDAKAQANRHATDAETQRKNAAKVRSDAMTKRQQIETLMAEIERLEAEAAASDHKAAEHDGGKEHYQQQDALHRSVARDLHNAIRDLARTPDQKELLNRLEEAEAQALAQGTVGHSLTVPPTAGFDPQNTMPFTTVDAVRDATGGGI